ncbi:hypothetical protein C0J52_10683 [Blattella germanica]|nr:hypothetical protein C0J52_10683 [Blattella germanica]
MIFLVSGSATPRLDDCFNSFWHALTTLEKQTKYCKCSVCRDGSVVACLPLIQPAGDRILAGLVPVIFCSLKRTAVGMATLPTLISAWDTPTVVRPLSKAAQEFTKAAQEIE